MIFDFHDYKKYLNAVLQTEGMGRGSRSRLAEALNCQTTFISNVLNGDSHFSLEHAALISKFLNHTLNETRYFILLVSHDRAGSKILEDIFMAQITEIQKKRTQIKERITTDHKLTPEIQMRYYSAWYYAAIHVATSISTLQTRDAIVHAVGLAPALVTDCLEFLVEAGLVVSQKNKYVIGPVRMHLGADSPMISKHHANWRLKSIQSLETINSDDALNLNYSNVLTLSRLDAKKIRDILLRTIDETEKVFRPSPEETIYSLGIDWFKIAND